MQTLAFGMVKQWDPAVHSLMMGHDVGYYEKKNVYIMCDWVTLLCSRELTEHYKATIMEKIKIIKKIKV